MQPKSTNLSTHRVKQRNTPSVEVSVLLRVHSRVGIPGNPDPEIQEFQPIFTNPDPGIVGSKIPRLQVFQNHRNVWLVVISFA